MTEKPPDKSPNHKNPIFTILAIDGVADEPGLFKKFLKTEGHYVLRSDSAADALAKTKRFQPDLILLGRDIEGIS